MWNCGGWGGGPSDVWQMRKRLIAWTWIRRTEVSAPYLAPAMRRSF